MTRWKIGTFAALAAGFALTVGMVLYVGLGSLLKAVDTIGWGGFVLFSAYSILVFVPLGLAWWAVAPGLGVERLWAFVWGRLQRESASDVLPFSQVGGLVVGVRVVGQMGIAEALVVASLIVDLTTEMAAQLIYTIFGAAMLAATLSHATGARDLLLTAGLALLAGGGLLVAFVLLQGRGVDILGAVAGRWVKDTPARADAVRAVLKSIYALPGRLGASFGLHAVGWITSGVGSWIALALMGAHIPLWAVLTLESLIAAVKGVAFMTPGGLGFQEGAYVLVAPLFGLPPETALALSLIKRGKDIAIGVPALLLWQVGEGRRLVLKS
jgi:putative membrane protein